jgi:tRNA 2-thiouridine synthesizing protein A
MSRGWFSRKGTAQDQQAGPVPVPGAATPASAVPEAPGVPVAPAVPRASAASAASAAGQPRALVTIDALGRKCPIPIIMLAEQIRDVPVGAVIAVLADDPAAYTDVPAWCGMKSHEFVFRSELDSGWAFGIRRRY